MIEHLAKTQELNNILYDIPEFLLTVSDENETLFNYIMLIVDNVYAPMLTNKCLSYIDILDLHYINASLKDSVSDLNQIKIIGIQHYLKTKLDNVNLYAKENELYEILHNLNLFHNVSEKIEKMNIY